VHVGKEGILQTERSETEVFRYRLQVGAPQQIHNITPLLKGSSK
jgi:hypothetical protein